MSRATALLLVSLTLGLGWAIRGHFGHEWGACWAGSMAALAVVVAARREDWSLRMPVLVALGGIGWAVGGIMSYGLIAGYCKAPDFANACYGFCMLGVVGGLYGFIGGGMLGLGLESTEENKPHWPALLTEMVAGAMLFWSVLIWEFEWYMTPPRSELWAACLGASVALSWFLHRNGFHRALRVAGYSALGAGFGFAFGDFLHLLGPLTGLSQNWWNLAEFTLGFFGGLGMAYAIFTRQWPQCVGPLKPANWLALAFLLLAVPATNIFHVFDVKEFTRMAEGVGHPDPAGFASWQVLCGWIALVVLLVPCAVAWQRAEHKGRLLTDVGVPAFLIGYSALYVVFSHLKKGVFLSGYSFQLEQYLYWAVLAVIAVIWLVRGRTNLSFSPPAEHAETGRKWVAMVLVLLVLIALMALISMNMHEGLGGSNRRF